jgi:hypothetical protein
MNGNGHTKPAPTPEQVREQIEAAREQIATSAAALRQEMALRFDWREWVRRRPGAAVLGAFGIGLFIGSRD